MNYNTVYVGMDVHKEKFSLCCYTNEKEQAEYYQKVDGHYSKVINYLEAMRFHYGDNVFFSISRVLISSFSRLAVFVSFLHMANFVLLFRFPSNP